MSLSADQRSDVARIRSDLAGLAVSLGWVRFERSLLHKYRTDQPREPAGNPGGGRWVSDGPIAYGNDATGGSTRTEETITEDGSRVLTLRIRSNPSADLVEQHTVVSPEGERTIFETSGWTQTIRDGASGTILGRSTLTREGAEPEAFVQNVRDLRPLRRGVAQTLEAAATLFTVLSSRNRPDRTAIFTAPASEYKTNEKADGQAIWVGTVDQKDLDDACPRNGEVQSLANAAAASVRAEGNYFDEQDFGNKVHVAIAKVVRDQHDPNFVAEVSLLPVPKPDVPYGTRTSIRLDVLEQRSSSTVCVYDHKTGVQGLQPKRATRIATIVQKNFPAAQRIMLIEVRPRP